MTSYLTLLPLAFALLLAAIAIFPSEAFRAGRHPYPARPIHVGPIASTEDAVSDSITPSLDPKIASQFTIQVCTSTSCCRRMKERGLDEYFALGEIYAFAQSANAEKCVIIEDGGCQGGRNCQMGPCVAIQHEDFMGNVALEGMNSNEFKESVFHNVITTDDAARVWSCVENAITTMMAEEEDADY